MEPTNAVENYNAQDEEQTPETAVEERKVQERTEIECQTQKDTAPVKAEATGKGKAEGEPGMSSRKTRSSKKQVMEKPEEHVTTPTNKKKEKDNLMSK